MSNDLFNQYGRKNNQFDFSQISAQVKQLQKQINGDPRQIVQNLLSSGQMTQAQFNQFAELANQIMPSLIW